MNKLKRIDRAEVKSALLPALRRNNKVVGAYLFGSVLEECRPDSDIDVGIIFTPEKEYLEKEGENTQEAILSDLPHFQGHPLDLVILNQASAIFAHKVISEGELIYARDLDAVTDFIEIVSRQRAENYTRYRQALEEIVKG